MGVDQLIPGGSFNNPEYDSVDTEEQNNTFKYPTSPTQFKEFVEELGPDRHANDGEGYAVDIGSQVTTVSEQIDVPAAIRIKGRTPRASVIEADPTGFTGDELLSYTPDGTEQFWGSFRDIKLDGSEQDGPTIRGLVTGGVNGGEPNDVDVQRCFFNRFANAGLFLEDAWGYRLNFNLVEYSGSNLGSSNTEGAMTVSNSSQCYFHQHYLAHNFAKWALVIDGGTDMEWTATQIRDNDYHGARVNSSKNIFNGLIVRDNSQANPGVYRGMGITGQDNTILGAIFRGGAKKTLASELVKTTIPSSVPSFKAIRAALSKLRREQSTTNFGRVRRQTVSLTVARGRSGTVSSAVAHSAVRTSAH